MPRTLCDGPQTLWKLYMRLKDALDNGKANPDEPCFLLRGQDALAPDVVRHWEWQLMQNSGSKDLREQARDIADAMERWPNRKVPD